MSQFWWEPYFTDFEKKLPLALRHTYQYFDVAVPRRNLFRDENMPNLNLEELGTRDFALSSRRDSDNSPTNDNSPSLLRSKYSNTTSAQGGLSNHRFNF